MLTLLRWKHLGSVLVWSGISITARASASSSHHQHRFPDNQFQTLSYDTIVRQIHDLANDYPHLAQVTRHGCWLRGRMVVLPFHLVCFFHPPVVVDPPDGSWAVEGARETERDRLEGIAGGAGWVETQLEIAIDTKEEHEVSPHRKRCLRFSQFGCPVLPLSWMSWLSWLPQCA